MGRISELQDEVSRRKKHVTQLDHQIHTLNENISTLTKELELKGKEVLKIRSEANQQIRYAPADPASPGPAGIWSRTSQPCRIDARQRRRFDPRARPLSSLSHVFLFVPFKILTFIVAARMRQRSGCL